MYNKVTQFSPINNFYNKERNIKLMFFSFFEENLNVHF